MRKLGQIVTHPLGWLAFRYFRFSRGVRFLPLLTGTAIASIAVAIFSLISVLSVMRGFDRELTSRLLGINPHVAVTAPQGRPATLTSDDMQRLLAHVELQSINATVEGEIIAQHQVGDELLAQGLRLRGLEANALKVMRKTTVLTANSQQPEPIADIQWDKGSAHDTPVLLGVEAAAQLTVHPAFSNTLRVTAPIASISPTGEFMPRQRQVQLQGVFRTGVYELDNGLMLMPLEDARRFLGQQAQEGFAIYLRDPHHAPLVAKRLASQLPHDWRSVPWQEQNKRLLAALRLERLGMMLVLGMVTIVASFAMMGVLLMMAAAKRREMAVLRALGATSAHVRKLFLHYAVLVGGTGIAVGSIGAVIVCLALQRWPMSLPTSYAMDALPVVLSWWGTSGFIVASLLICVVAGWYPALLASRENVSAQLRYE